MQATEFRNGYQLLLFSNVNQSP